LIGIATDPGVGGTFLTWSLHYLAGHETYYHAQIQQWLKVPSNPLTKKNSHGFKTNQIGSLESFNKNYSTLLDIETHDFHTIYFHNFSATLESQDSDTQQVISKLKSDQLIVVSLSPENQLYQQSYNKRSDNQPSLVNPAIRLSSNQDILTDFINFFLKESNEKWHQLGLTNTWDQREFLALNLGPYKTHNIVCNIDLTRDHYRLNASELWHTFDQTVACLFNYLNLKIDATRWKNWNKVYYKWRQVHYQRMLFVWYFDQIVDYIINGYSMDLTRFNLDLIQEAVIQHELIYKHKLNLKTWQLEKFNNTKQLHDLLEPNIHPLTII